MSALPDHRPEVIRNPSRSTTASHFDVVIVGGGAGGLATAASLQRRDRDVRVAVIEPSASHRYQPGWTLVGGGVFRMQDTLREQRSLIPRGVTWIRSGVQAFDPDHHQVRLENGDRIGYRALVASPGIHLAWERIEGLTETLGCNGVTSNYRPETAPYTWELVSSLRGGRAVFTQPPMPIKCAGAPQKALYLSCNHWERQGRLGAFEVSLRTAGGVLFGVPDYVPALEGYMDRYGAHLYRNENLVAVDGPARKAWFSLGNTASTREVDFDLLHVVPPQVAPEFVRESALADDAGWIDVDRHTLQHVRYPNVFALGDACSTPNAKTAAAVRKQAPVVAVNVLAHLAGREPQAGYDGYGSCPLTVERGRVVLAEFGYDGVLAPTLPQWLFDGRKATRAGWWLKAGLLPAIYFDLMLKGREWLAAPRPLAEFEGVPAAG